MNRMFCVTLIWAGIQLVGSAHAGLLSTDGAEPVPARHLELELNGSYSHDRDHRSPAVTRTASTDADVSLTAGIVDGVDIAIALPYTFNNRVKCGFEPSLTSEGFSDLTVDLKVLLLNADELKLAVKPGVILPTGDSRRGLSDGHAGIALAVLATREFAAGKVLLHANVGYVSHNYKDVAVRNYAHGDLFTVSVAGETEIADNLSFAVDTGLETSTDKSCATPPAYLLAGLSYDIGTRLEVYAGIKAGLTRPENDITALFGVKLK